MESDNMDLNISSVQVELTVESFNAEFTQKTLVSKIIFGLTAVGGFIANVLVVYIYGIKYKRCNFKYFLFVMGLIGIVQCSIMLPTQIAEMHYWFVFPTSWLCRVSAYVFGYTLINCYFVLLLIAIDRFRKVCCPYGWQIQSNTARNLCVIVSIAALVFATPPGIISGHHSYVTSYHGQNITVTVCATDDIYKDRDWAIYFLLLFGGIPISIVILITCVLYGLILKQFYKGPVFTLRSLYNTTSIMGSKDKVSYDIRDQRKSSTPVKIIDKSESSPVKAPTTPIKTESTPSIKRHAETLRKVFSSILPNRDSIKSDQSSSGPLRSSGSYISKRGVRDKLMRKTFIVLIITITCIIALVITFCLHIVAENINQNVLTISSAKLNAFVIFHRGSFSIICAIFPIIYGIRDLKFRLALRRLFVKTAQRNVNIQTNMSEDSKC